jgi:hypothetical protein
MPLPYSLTYFGAVTNLGLLLSILFLGFIIKVSNCNRDFDLARIVGIVAVYLLLLTSLLIHLFLLP